MARESRQVGIEAAVWEGVRPRRSLMLRLARLARTKPLGAFGALVIAILVIAAVFAEPIAPYDPNKSYFESTLAAPSSQFWMGNDNLGRDVFSRVVFGSRISLMVGLLSVGMGTLHGTLWGLISGYIGGRFDLVVQRVMDSIMAIPFLIFALTVVAVLGPSIMNVILALAFAQTPRSNRVVRGTVISVKENQYIEAARAVGVPNWRIVALHILPNVLAPIVVIATVSLGGAIIAEASLSFLGLGTPPPTPTWGGMLSQVGRQYLEQAPWIAIFPGIAISVVVLAFNLFGDALRDVLDPRLRT